MLLPAPVRRPDAVAYRLLDVVVVWTPGDAEAILLSGLEADVWDLCDGHRDTAAITLALADAATGLEGRGELLVQVRRYLDALAARGLVEVSQPTAVGRVSRGVHSGFRASPVPEVPEWLAADNGYTSMEAMDAAHGPILDLAIVALAGAGGPVIDLGCGNGVLLQRLRDHDHRVVPYGIDIDPGRIDHARALQPEYAAHFVAGDLFDASPVLDGTVRYKLAVLAPRRLLEVDPTRRAWLLDRLRECCDLLLLYVPFGSRETLVDRARWSGLALRGTTDNSNESVAVSLGWVEADRKSDALP